MQALLGGDHSRLTRPAALRPRQVRPARAFEQELAAAGPLDQEVEPDRRTDGDEHDEEARKRHVVDEAELAERNAGKRHGQHEHQVDHDRAFAEPTQPQPLSMHLGQLVLSDAFEIRLR